MPNLEQEGDYQGRILNASLYQSDAGSVGINFDLEIIRSWEKNEWVNWHPQHPNYKVRGTAWIVKKTGEIDTGLIENICRATGWDGNLSLIDSPDFGVNKLIQFSVKSEEYKGQTQYKASFFKPCSDSVGGKMSDDKLSALAERYGRDIRTIAKDVKPAVQVYTPPTTPPVTQAPPATPPGEDEFPY